MNTTILQGDVLDKLAEIQTESIDCIVTDPPYFLLNSSGKGFMGKEWDSINIKNTYNMVCRSKELADFAVKFFELMRVELNTAEESTAQENVNMQDKKIIDKNLDVQSVKNSLKDTNQNQNTFSAPQFVITKDALWDLLKELLENRTTSHPEQNPFQSALYVIPYSILIKKLKGIALENVLKSPIKSECLEKETHLTLMDEVRINAVIEAMIGIPSEKESTKEIDGNVEFVKNTANKKRYKLITLSHGEKQKITHWLILLLYAMYVTQKLNRIPTNTDLHYQIMSEFNKSWMRESLRVLKPGAFAYIMCAPRQDVLSVIMQCCNDAGFKTNFTSIYYTFASGFPKASNIGKMADKKNGRGVDEYKALAKYIRNSRLKLKISMVDILKKFPSKTENPSRRLMRWENGSSMPNKEQWQILKEKLSLDDSFDKLIERGEAKREVIGVKRSGIETAFTLDDNTSDKVDITIPSTNLAKKLDGSYAGFQPKPALEVILVCMKPLSEKSYTDQAMQNGKGISWFNDCRIPFDDDKDVESSRYGTGTTGQVYNKYNQLSNNKITNTQGRFPANVLVSDDVLNDDKVTKSTGGVIKSGNTNQVYGIFNKDVYTECPNDSGSFSRYFDLDSWQAQFLIVEKASKTEKNAGLDSSMVNTDMYSGKFPNSKKLSTISDGRKKSIDNPFQRGETKRQNTHPTIKPISLMSYLITMGSREGDIILDPFAGSGTTLVAASLLKRHSIGIEFNPDYCTIMKNRLDYWKSKTFEKLQKIKKQAEKEKIQKLETFL